jgi:pyroglutamyl-peptidase
VLYIGPMREKADERPTVLLTGFGPFPGVTDNASATLIRNVVHLARGALPEFRIAHSVLPTEWGRGSHRIVVLHKRFRPVLALHFGVASDTRTIRLETIARNFCRASLDDAGVLPSASVLCDDGTAERRVTVDVAAIADALKAGGWPYSISDDAGGYLCNAVLYHSLALADARGGCRVGFVHIPADLSKPPLRLQETADAAVEIIRVALEPIRTGAGTSLHGKPAAMRAR